MEIKLGIGKAVQKEAAEGLRDLLANTYILYLKTQNFHWNVTGPEFFSLHLLFEKQYEEMAEAVDEIAERLRALGQYVEASLSSFLKRGSIAEARAMSSSKKMILELLEGHEAISREGRPLIARFQEIHDDVSSDLLIKRLTFHEKAAWMLRSHL
jgi:starvation-inducible DNA-binding protein